MKRSRTTIIGIACGLACAACVFAYAQGVRERPTRRARKLWRATGRAAGSVRGQARHRSGESVDASAVETRLWVADLLPAEAFRSSDDAVGKKASSTILAGEVLSERRFRDAGSRLDVPEGLTALSVPAKDVQAVGGAVAAGSRVDVYATGGTSTDVLASGVLVLATSASAQESTTDAKVSWITVAVAPSRCRRSSRRRRRRSCTSRCREARESDERIFGGAVRRYDEFAASGVYRVGGRESGCTGLAAHFLLGRGGAQVPAHGSPG